MMGKVCQLECHLELGLVLVCLEPGLDLRLECQWEPAFVLRLKCPRGSSRCMRQIGLQVTAGECTVTEEGTDAGEGNGKYESV